MLRPGPYICGEWDFGGFPAWLLSIEPPLKLRSSDPAFLHLVEKWWGVLLPKIAPLLYNNGGPIIMVQVENEYGSYGDDKNYLHQLVSLARRHLGDEIILYTTDGGSRDTLEKGTIRGAGVFSAIDFSTGDEPWSKFKLQKEFNEPGKSPPICTEFYTGWLTHWGEKLAATNAQYTANALETILSRNGSAVLYMVHGGTNFGFLNGANTGSDDSDFKPDITSYDYDAPIREWGDSDSPKFKALRKVIKKYSPVSVPRVPPNNGKRGYGKVKLQKRASFFDVQHTIQNPKDVVEAKNPVFMESVGQMFGFLLYVSEYPAKKNRSILSIPKVHDRAQVYVSCSLDERINKYVGKIERWATEPLEIPSIRCASTIRLSILVENMGRLNYGPYVYDRKGILSDVVMDGSVLHGWRMIPFSFQNLSKLFKESPIVGVGTTTSEKELSHSNLEYHSELLSEGPMLYEGHFTINSTDEIADTFISFSGWGKGIASVNDFNIGRFWPLAGPQCSLYVPAPLLRTGKNVVIILETDAPNHELVVESIDQQDFTCGQRSRSGTK
ncbi:beta-galactosidase 17-like [Papaver somniferum]|nr:beta-galactosidase 17-like [Papaver somniferum]